MKTTLLRSLLLIAFLCTIHTSYSQTTAIPDINFEAYLEANSLGNGINGNGLVTTANINTVTFLDISSVGTIADLTGIEDFTALTDLICEANKLINY